MSNAHAREPRIYLVEWPYFNIAKIGVTTCDRWKGFTSRGGVLVYLTEPSADALAREAEWHEQMRVAGWPKAFDCKEAAVPFLGMGGAGWTECYRMGEPGPHREYLRSVDELAARRAAR